MKNNILKLVTWIPLSGLLTGSVVEANDSVNSELSHFTGNAVIASVVSVVVHKYWPQVKKPARTGFIVSASEAVAGEAAEYATGGKFSLLDVAAGTVGAAAGAYVTDKWYIAPRLNTQKGETTVGLVAIHRF